MIEVTGQAYSPTLLTGFGHRADPQPVAARRVDRSARSARRHQAVRHRCGVEWPAGATRHRLPAAVFDPAGRPSGRRAAPNVSGGASRHRELGRAAWPTARRWARPRLRPPNASSTRCCSAVCALNALTAKDLDAAHGRTGRQPGGGACRNRTRQCARRSPHADTGGPDRGLEVDRGPSRLPDVLLLLPGGHHHQHAQPDVGAAFRRCGADDFVDQEARARPRAAPGCRRWCGSTTRRRRPDRRRSTSTRCPVTRAPRRARSAPLPRRFDAMPARPLDASPLELPVGSSGVLVGTTQRGDLLLLSLTDPDQATRIALHTGMPYACQLLVRAAAVGERIAIYTDKPARWRQLEQPLIAVVDRRHPPEFVPSIIVSDRAGGPPPAGLASTVITIGDAERQRADPGHVVHSDIGVDGPDRHRRPSPPMCRSPRSKPSSPSSAPQARPHRRARIACAD